ncbi:MAG: alanyl-tRNA editing protein [Anaerolineales bacterium]
MAERLYHEDAYLREFDAVVTAVSEGWVALDRTAFYPRGGGQPSDQGQIFREGDSFAVTQAKTQEGEIWHAVDLEGLREGDGIVGKVDWQHRYRIMRTHTAMHILCGVIWRDYGASVTGGNMTPGRGRMDFEFERMQRELVEEIEEKINSEVQAARPVTAEVLPREEAFRIPDLIRTKVNLLPEGIQEVRVVEINGLDLQADGGTHVGNTSEVGRIRIVDYKSKGRINKRLIVELED